MVWIENGKHIRNVDRKKGGSQDRVLGNSRDNLMTTNSNSEDHIWSNAAICRSSCSLILKSSSLWKSLFYGTLSKASEGSVVTGKVHWANPNYTHFFHIQKNSG
ncbi:hypothetical protein JTB14_031122 [Gonioctena quinquepunctata]|nr:hypothetical protein JTB14_031122 [Gonioctena quinquepunctata]